MTCSFFWFFGDILKPRGKASTLNGLGRNSQKQDAKHACIEKETPRRKKWKNRRDLGGVNEGRKDHGYGLGMI